MVETPPQNAAAKPKLWKLIVILVIVGGGAAAWTSGVLKLPAKAVVETPNPTAHLPMELVDGLPDTLRCKKDDPRALGIEVVEVQSAPPPPPLRLPGSLSYNADRYVRVHSRFSGEVVRMGNFEGRPVRLGDRIKKGQLLAVLWSKDIGEKKSELSSAIALMHRDKATKESLEKVGTDVLAKRVIIEAEKAYEADVAAVAKAERTLLSWQLSEQTIQDIYQEAKDVMAGKKMDPNNAKKWAEAEIVCPIDGTIIEKTFNVGDIIDPTSVVAVVSDLSKLMVIANIYEENIPLLRTLSPENQIWKVDLKSDPNDIPRLGKIELINNVIDPAQHTGVAMGFLDNTDGGLISGAFITASVDFPSDPTLVAVPPSAVLEEGNRSFVFIELPDHKNTFQLRQVRLARRGNDLSFVKTLPSTDDQAEGCQPLKKGERVVSAGVLRLEAELRDLQSSTPKPKEK